ncbi:phospholipase [Aggregicoccus sp. 17bor-14]|uniref:phospholipase D-like domain-containing protein n=1 Tax=Myxococcaceae TaxID=31 RepID=UPI00129C7C5C|nr:MULTISPECIES: phospholipase D-like domain-containing protein [Myxococcaceae]MBF5043380.1 phospholipase [Simulacricoccus sp. 17bor-14]MRI89138.1 phospholipase [Aggregicoccus sp. 17bor-14]
MQPVRHSPARLVPLLLALACAAPGVRAPAAGPQAAPPELELELELVESAPVETPLNHAALRDAKDVWPELFARATRTLDVAEFYLSNSNREGSALEPSVRALEAAAARGVRVRILTEEKFARTYPETVARLQAQPNVSLRRWDREKLQGGVLHAKYFVVDGREGYLGSQNFDWRSLEHIQELGLRLSGPAAVRPLSDVFAYDWAQAGGEPLPSASGPAAAWTEARFGGERVRVLPVASPEGQVPASSAWDLPQLVRLIDGARRTVRVQLLTYRARSREGNWEVLESALQRAALRGVQVELLLADWGKRKGTIEGLQALHAPERGLTVKLVTIPQHSSGHIPFARVVHSKYLVVDGEKGWVGTNNWERSYFHGSRNVGLVVEGAAFARQLDAFFLDLWNSTYASPVDPKAVYTPPDIAGAEGK